MAVNRPCISIQKQLGKVLSTYPSWSGKVARNGLVLEGKVQPTALSPVYVIRIKYTLKRRPIVKVVSHKLNLHPEKDKLPHIFTQNNSLCLHYSDFDYYNDYLSDTIIVWVTWWLYFYETWLATGEWYGGGKHVEN